MPLRPAVLQFSAPVPRATAQALRLVPQAGGTPIAPRLRDEDTAAWRAWSFPAPLPENTQLRLVLPAGVSDEAGRALANAERLPAGRQPPARCRRWPSSPAPFGIVEAGAGRGCCR
jgi:hypothetical protein